MLDDRGTVINIDGESYNLILTTLATKEIAKKFGGLEELGETLSDGKDIAEMFDAVLWLVALLANQGIKIHNYKNKDSKKDEIDVEMLEIFTSPLELTEFKDAIMEAITKGTTRHVESEGDEKNGEAAG